MTKAAADRQPLRVAPVLQAQETAHYRRQFSGELFDRALHESGRLDVIADQDLVELALADVVGIDVAERIVVIGAQFLAHLFDDRIEGAVAGAVADEFFTVAQFDVERIDADGG